VYGAVNAAWRSTLNPPEMFEGIRFRLCASALNCRVSPPAVTVRTGTAAAAGRPIRPARRTVSMRSRLIRCHPLFLSASRARAYSDIPAWHNPALLYWIYAMFGEVSNARRTRGNLAPGPVYVIKNGQQSVVAYLADGMPGQGGISQTAAGAATGRRYRLFYQDCRHGICVISGYFRTSHYGNGLCAYSLPERICRPQLVQPL
jgi:hypothetical protein